MDYEEAYKLTSSDNERDLDNVIAFLEDDIPRNPRFREPSLCYLGKAYWKKAKLTGMTTKKYTTDGWRFMNKALLCWFKALPIPGACEQIAKVRRWQTRFYFNGKNYKHAIQMIEEIKKTEDILNKAWEGRGPLFTKSDQKLLDKCKFHHRL